jgi:hypothetical protein
MLAKCSLHTESHILCKVPRPHLMMHNYEENVMKRY